MALEVYWTKKADKRFNSIIEYLNENWGYSVASNFVNEVFDFLDLLANFPNIGTIENELLNIRGFVINKQTTLFYQIRNEKLILLNFYDNRQKPKEIRY